MIRPVLLTTCLLALLTLQGCGAPGDATTANPAATATPAVAPQGGGGLTAVPVPPGAPLPTDLSGNPQAPGFLTLELIRDGFATTSTTNTGADAPPLRVGDVLEACATAAQAGFLTFWDRRAAPGSAQLEWQRLYPADGVLQVQAGQRICLRERGQELYVQDASINAALVAHWTALQEHAAPPATAPVLLNLPAGAASVLAEVRYTVAP